MRVRAHQRVAPVKDAPHIREELRVPVDMGQPIKSWMIAATRAGIRTNRAEGSSCLQRVHNTSAILGITYLDLFNELRLELHSADSIDLTIDVVIALNEADVTNFHSHLNYG